MNGYDFERKLKRLNPELYLGRTVVDYFNGELGSTGIYLKRRDPSGQSLANEVTSAVLGKPGSVSAKDARYLKEADLYLGGVTLKHIPEGNVYNPDQSLWAKGWREILLNLIASRVVHVERARKVFECPSLGYSDWDNMSDLQKYETHKYSREQVLDCLSKQ